MKKFGAAYRALYSAEGLFSRAGCPPIDSIYIWTDLDQRTKATGTALLEGLAPGCGLKPRDAEATIDPLFHALPSLGKADSAQASASLAGSIGAAPQAIVPAYALAFKRLDQILVCETGACRRISQVPSTVAASQKTGLVEVQGAVDLASTAVEDFILAYADGRPIADVGWGAVDRATLLQLSQLHVLKFLLNTQTPYPARVQGSNLLSHISATLDQGAANRPNVGTRVPIGARLVAFIGHDTNLAELAGMLRLGWLLPGYQIDDSPPGVALVFELRRSSPSATPFVRVFFTAQSLDQIRNLSSESPQRVPVFVPVCPQLDGPLDVFDRVLHVAIDSAFVGTW